MHAHADVPVPTPAVPPASASAAPDDRATTFQAVEGGTEQYSGGTLLVAAYALVWLFIMAYLAMLWRKQAALHVRLDELERAIDRRAESREA